LADKRRADHRRRRRRVVISIVVVVTVVVRHDLALVRALARRRAIVGVNDLARLIGVSILESVTVVVVMIVV
jgi:hypothetical protein